MENKDIEKQIRLYDNMNEAWNHVPEEAGDEMKKIGLIGKAIEYYNASGKGWSKECEELEKLAFKSEEGMKENFRYIFYMMLDNPEGIKRNIYVNYEELRLPEEVPGYIFHLETKTPQGKN